jgi:hypothetical protein
VHLNNPFKWTSNISDFVDRVKEEALLAKWHQLRLKTVKELSAEKLTTSVANEAKIRDLKGKDDFMSEEDVKAEEIKFRLKVKKSKEVSSIINSKNYLSKEDLKLKKDEEEKEKLQCLNCSVKYTVAQLSKGSCGHIFCNNCYRPGTLCINCRGFYCYALVAMGKSNFIDPLAKLQISILNKPRAVCYKTFLSDFEFS